MSQPGPAVADPRLGIMLQERYRIVRKLGDGGMGAVYEAEHVLIKRRVAIKVLHPRFANNPEIVARFHREAQAATSINHANIIEVTDMGRFPDGTAYMVLEYLEGRDWSDDLKAQGPQPLGKVVHILTQVCDALVAAHANGIVHRDLKPENIYLIERDGDPCFAKVLDFGISKLVDAAGQDRSLTQTGTALGTPYYMAPEQCQGKKDIDRRADIYSLGVILFQSLTGQYPFDDESYPMLVLKICTEPAPSLATYRPDLPHGVEQIVQRMLAKLPDQRYSSCAEIKAALARYAGDTAAPVVALDAPSTANRGPSVLAAGAPLSSATKTANLPGPLATVPTATPYPAHGEASGRGLIMAVVAMLGSILVAGVGVGAFLAFRGTSPADTVASRPPEAVPEPAASEPAEEPPEEPAVVQEPAAPTVETTRVVIVATPANATISVDGTESVGRFEGILERGTHRVIVRLEGYETNDRERRFGGIESTVNIPLERASAHEAHTHRVRPRDPRPNAVEPVVRPTAPTTRPPPGGAGGDTVHGDTVFGGPRGSQLNNADRVF